MLEEMKASQEYSGTLNPRIAQLESLLTVEKQKQTQDEAKQRMESYTQTYRQKINQKIIDSGQNPEDGKFDDVWEAFDIAYAVDGKFERAEKKLGRILEKKPEVKPSGIKETEEERIERLAEEKSNAKLKDLGYLNIEEGGPSAGETRWETVRDKYIEDPDNPKNKAEYHRMRIERGI